MIFIDGLWSGDELNWIKVEHNMISDHMVAICT